MTRLVPLALALLFLLACPLPDDSGDACDGFVDGDGDGYGAELDDSCDGVALGGDCDDTRDDVAPDGNEVCDGVDNDCDGEVDNDPVEGTLYWVDADGDGYGGGEAMALCERPEGVVLAGGDCDDDDGSVHPEAVDTFNGLDDDCDGTADGDGTLCGTVMDPDRDPTCPQEQIVTSALIVDSTAGLEPLHLVSDLDGHGCDHGPDGFYISGDLAYPLYVPPGAECVVTLDDSCDSRLDMFIKRSDFTCPRANQPVMSCEYADTGSITIEAADFGRSFEIYVGASDGLGGIFALTVSC